MAMHLRDSDFQVQQEKEREEFIQKEILKPKRYDEPPESVLIARIRDIPRLAFYKPTGLRSTEVVFYSVGMTKIRSDPYTVYLHSEWHWK